MSGGVALETGHRGCNIMALSCMYIFHHNIRIMYITTTVHVRLCTHGLSRAGRLQSIVDPRFGIESGDPDL